MTHQFLLGQRHSLNNCTYVCGFYVLSMVTVPMATWCKCYWFLRQSQYQPPKKDKKYRNGIYTLLSA